MPINSCLKGKIGEKEFAELLRSHGISARRGQQYCGSPDSPDVVSELPVHWEIKRVEALNVTQAMAKAIEDAGGKIAAVAHRKNKCEWLITMRAKDLIPILKRMTSPPGAYGENPLDGEAARDPDVS